MARVWTDSFRFQTMFKVELYAAEAMSNLGVIPQESFSALATVDPNRIDPKRIAELEKTSRHETIAFLTHIEELVGEDNASFLHFGMTSNDTLDSCFSVQLKLAADLLNAEVESLCNALKTRAFEHKWTICAGRSHGVHAEPTTFGLKMAFAYAEMQRNKKRITAAQQEISVGAISGPVGTFAGLGTAVEKHVCERLGLKPETISTQIIPRDRHAAFFSSLATTAASIERFAIEIRSLQRTEIGEVSESFASGQKGSSAMPHKRNPILSENISGLARLIRAQASAALENVLLWHERDMSHSSVERIIAPDVTLALDFALSRMTGIVEQITINKDRMRDNLKLTRGSYFSHRVLSALVKAGAKRAVAYKVVQHCTARVHNEGVSFLDALKSDHIVGCWLPMSELNLLFENDHYLSHVDEIFNRVFAPNI